MALVGVDPIEPLYRLRHDSLGLNLLENRVCIKTVYECNGIEAEA